MSDNYQSPRWTSEILDCSMPMSFDTYNYCSYGCLYCFALYQKIHTLGGLKAGGFKVKCSSVEKLKSLFLGAPHGSHSQFLPYVKARKIMQWGALADPFDNYEKRFGKSLELLRFFDGIDYPLSFSTKGTWWTQDPRYMSLMARHKHNWHTKVSIITMNADMAKKMERGVASPQERMDMIGRLTARGLHVTLRLRPYMIGLSEDWRETIKEAKRQGADSVSTEFWCMDQRADAPLRKRYDEISKLVGFDVWTFYHKHSQQAAYKRLNREIKLPVFKAMRDYTHDLGMRFYVSDSFCREMNDSVNCCGVPPEWNSYTGHFGQAILCAKAKGETCYADIKPEVDRFFTHFLMMRGEGYNSHRSLWRARYRRATAADWFEYNWNQPNTGRGLVRLYGYVLVPDRLDAEGNIIYKYNEEADK